MTGLGSSSSNSLTIRSTDTASLSCRWLVKSRIFRQALRQSCQVTKCLLVAIWSNIWRCWRFPRSTLISVVNGYILNITKYQTHTFKSHYTHTPSMILSSVTPCANFSWISFWTDWGSGRYLHSSSPSKWFLWVQIYVTSTLPVDW